MADKTRRKVDPEILRAIEHWKRNRKDAVLRNEWNEVRRIDKILQMLQKSIEESAEASA